MADKNSRPRRDHDCWTKAQGKADIEAVTRLKKNCLQIAIVKFSGTWENYDH